MFVDKTLVSSCCWVMFTWFLGGTLTVGSLLFGY